MLCFTSRIKYWYIMPSAAACAFICGWLLFKWIKKPEKIAPVITGVFLAAAVVIVFTPVSISSKRFNDVKQFTQEVNENVPEGKAIVNYRMPYWDFQNQFIFYTDRSITKTIEDPAIVIEKMKNNNTAAISYAGDFKAAFGPYKDKIIIIKQVNDKVLFKCRE